MFTGIIEELGTVQRIEKGINSSQLYIQARQVLADTKIGDSIAVNGVCLTVTEYGDDYFVADVMAETLLRTTLKQLSNGTRVNLERALRVGDRMGAYSSRACRWSGDYCRTKERRYRHHYLYQS